MTKTSRTILFFGSGPVAAESLALLSGDFSVEAVITKPQPAHHKESFPVLALAEKLGLRMYTPSNKGELSELFAQQRFDSPVGVVIDYGIIINRDVIEALPLGIVNSHFSLLPEWRGADPITFSILSGQNRTGVSLMLINEALDEGPLLAQAELSIAADATTPSLTSELIELSHEMLKEILPRYIAGEVQPAEQLSATILGAKEPTYSRKLAKQDGVLDWNKPAEQLEREIRAFVEWPKSRTALGGIELIVTAAHTETVAAGKQPGDYSATQRQLLVQTGSGSLALDRVKPAGKPEMTIESFLNGYGKQL